MLIVVLPLLTYSLKTPRSFLRSFPSSLILSAKGLLPSVMFSLLNRELCSTFARGEPESYKNESVGGGRSPSIHHKSCGAKFLTMAQNPGQRTKFLFGVRPPYLNDNLAREIFILLKGKRGKTPSNRYLEFQKIPYLTSAARLCTRAWLFESSRVP